MVSESQIERITQGRLSVDDLDPETAMALTIYGVWGLGEVAYDEALNLSRSLNISLVGKPAGYNVEGRMIGVNQDAGGRRGRARRADAEDVGYHAPLVRSGSKLRLAAPEERSPKRLERPRTDWDVLHGMVLAYREGDVPVGRAYLEEHAGDRKQRILDLLTVWGAEATDKDVKQEAEAILFGLK